MTPSRQTRWLELANIYENNHANMNSSKPNNHDKNIDSKTIADTTTKNFQSEALDLRKYAKTVASLAGRRPYPTTKVQEENQQQKQLLPKQRPPQKQPQPQPQPEQPDSPRRMLKMAAYVDNRYKGVEESIRRMEEKFSELACSMGNQLSEWKSESYGKITDTEHMNTHYFDTLLL